MLRPAYARLCALLAGACAGVLATAAHAGTVSVESHAQTGGKILTFVAEPGELNSVSAGIGAQTVSVQDGFGGMVSTLQALPPCSLEAMSYMATCPRAGIDLIAADLGDLEDSFGGMIYTLPVVVFAGAGGDNVYGGSLDDALLGEGGADILNGGTGDDLLDGGPGPDRLIGDFAGATAPMGGSGDVADYSDRTAPVIVSLDGRAADGEIGEGDNVAVDVEDIYGGAGGDSLIGNELTNLLDGDAGDDVITAGAGSDALLGGTGADQLNARDGTIDYVECGPGPDTAIVDAADIVMADCEQVQPPASATPTPTPTPTTVTTASPTPVPVVAGPDRVPATLTVTPPGRPRVRSIVSRGLSLKISCSEACLVSGEIRITRKLARSLGLPAPRATVVIGRGTSARLSSGAVALTLTLTAKARTALRKLRTGNLSVWLTATDAAGNTSRTNVTVRPR
jgi:Ca2+-binding RTX toxin-like protein